MSWRRIAIMYAVAAVLGLYIYAVESRRAGDVEIPEVAALPIVPMLSSRITDLAVRWGDTAVRLKRDGERWNVVQPLGADIPSDLVSAVLDTLTTTAPIEAMDGEDVDVAEFGLDKPIVRLRIEGDRDKPIEVTLGSTNPTRTAIYAATSEDDTVYLIGLAASYYVELMFEGLDRERAGSGAIDSVQ